MSECPRCKSNSIKIGSNVIIQVGKTRSKRVDVLECPKCGLLYYESSKE